MSYHPSKKHRIIDCVASTGIEVSHWSDGSGDAANNPKYCFEWSFAEPSRSIFTFCVWTDEISTADNGASVVELNARKVAENVTRANSKRFHRARRMDQNLAMAFALDAAVRLIVINGDRKAEKQRVLQRGLDPVAWRITSYDDMTGSAVLDRGKLPVAQAS